jgi:hypothetical protein
MARRWRFSLSLSAPTLAADDVRRYAIAGTRALTGRAMGPAIPLSTIRCEPDAQLHAAMGGDVEPARGGRQVQLPLQLQLGFRGRFEVTTPVIRKRESMQPRKKQLTMAVAIDGGYRSSATALGGSSDVSWPLGPIAGWSQFDPTLNSASRCSNRSGRPGRDHLVVCSFHHGRGGRE